jgi:Cutinase
MKKTVTTVLATLLLTLGSLAVGSTALAAPASQAASQAAADPCSAPIAFLRNSSPLTDSIFQAFYKPSCSASAVQLTSGTYTANGVVMLPGTQNVIVAESDANFSGMGQLVEINAQTLSQTVIATIPTLGRNVTSLSASPTGNAVAYFRPADTVSGTPAGVYVQKLDGSAPVRISPNDVATYGTPSGGISWSHDGNDIAYITEQGDGDSVVYAPSSGTQVQTTVTHFTNIYLSSVAWTPNDQGLLVDQSNTLSYINRSTGAVTEVAFVPQGAGYLGIIGVAVDQHWNAYVVMNSGNDNVSISAVWLGNLGSFTTITSASGNWDDDPSVDTSGPADPMPPGFPPGASPACPSVQFFGVRGSGETGSDGGGYGSTVQEFELTLAQLEPGMSASEVNYSAISVLYAWQKYTDAYINSRVEGENALQTDLITFWHQCPTTYVVLAGYSQGAQVVGNVADTLQPADRARIAAVALFGDPKFNPRQPQVDVAATGYSNSRDGIVMHWPGMHDQLRQVPPDLVPRVHSYCLTDDPVCNFTKRWALACANPLQASDCTHLQYVVEEWPSKAAYWADGVLKTLPKL